MKIPDTGLFITFEGGDGSGKSVQCSLLYEKLKTFFPYLSVMQTREPGGSEGAELIRKMLLTGDQDRWFPLSEFLLFYAARYDHWCRKILPVLQQKGVVVCDRFFDSSFVYQGIGRGIPKEFFQFLHKMFDYSAEDRSFIPDRTYILEIDPIIGVHRSNCRQAYASQKEDRFERIDINFHKKIQQGYLKIAEENQQRCKIIQANQSIEKIHEEIWEDIQIFLQKSVDDKV